MKIKKLYLLSFLFLAAGFASPLEAAVLLAKDLTLAALPDPGGIAGDGAQSTSTPGWEIVANDSASPDVPLGSDVVRIATDLDANRQRARGIVQFDLGSITSGSYELSLLVRTANIRLTNTGLARNQTFAIRFVSTGEASLNGIQANASPWLVVKPLLDDQEGSGKRGPWFTMTLAAASGTSPDYDINPLEGTWDFSAPITLSNVDGSTGKFMVEILDGVGANYSQVYLSELTLTAVPEPGTAALLGVFVPVLVGNLIRRFGR